MLVHAIDPSSNDYDGASNDRAVELVLDPLSMFRGR